ncbi:hypothetical protein ACFQZE_07170 [Paenibacillus sp. GCM10027627]|uniref:hypothetical protein n=1 Tax=unclassified Paenibacillus TaxID=185978 RepID=UPI0036352BA6
MTAKLEAAIKKVNRYEEKLNNHMKLINDLGIDADAFWASFPAGSEERKALTQLLRINEDLSRAKTELLKREAIEEKKTNKKEVSATININQPLKWMQSNTGMWHIFGFELSGEMYPSCQSYNLDRPNVLHGESLNNPPEGAKVCKKCQGKTSGEKWAMMD